MCSTIHYQDNSTLGIGKCAHKIQDTFIGVYVSRTHIIANPKYACVGMRLCARHCSIVVVVLACLYDVDDVWTFFHWFTWKRRNDACYKTLLCLRLDEKSTRTCCSHGVLYVCIFVMCAFYLSDWMKSSKERESRNGTNNNKDDFLRRNSIN